MLNTILKLLKILIIIFVLTVLLLNLQFILTTEIQSEYKILLSVLSIMIIFYSTILIRNKIPTKKSKFHITMGIVSISYMCLAFLLNHKYHFNNTINIILLIPFIIFNIFFIFVFKENWLK